MAAALPGTVVLGVAQAVLPVVVVELLAWAMVVWGFVLALSHWAAAASVGLGWLGLMLPQAVVQVSRTLCGGHLYHVERQRRMVSALTISGPAQLLQDKSSGADLLQQAKSTSQERRQNVLGCAALICDPGGSLLTVQDTHCTRQGCIACAVCTAMREPGSQLLMGTALASCMLLAAGQPAACCPQP
jgi:hypothetical protein